MADDDLKLFVLKHGLTAEELAHLREIVKLAVIDERNRCALLIGYHLGACREHVDCLEAIARGPSVSA